jgi:hypothetical protein
VSEEQIQRLQDERNREPQFSLPPNFAAYTAAEREIEAEQIEWDRVHTMDPFE